MEKCCENRETSVLEVQGVKLLRIRSSPGLAKYQVISFYETSVSYRGSINRQKQHQQQYYDVHAKPLRPLAWGDSVRMRLPGEKTWSPGVCAGLGGPWSYEVKVGDRTFVRNRHHLIISDEAVVEDGPDVEQPARIESTETPSPLLTSGGPSPGDVNCKS